MSVKIIPEYGLPFRDNAGAEKKTLEFLMQLPSGYYVIRECRVDASIQKKIRGGQEDCLDLVIVGPSIGVVILEVKDWNIVRNSYIFANQHQVRKIDLQTGIESLISDPIAQAKEYLHAVKDVLSKNRQMSEPLWVSSFVVYPKLARAEFENRFDGMHGSNPQERLTFDFQSVFFADDLKRYEEDPNHLLELYVTREAKRISRLVKQYTDEQILDTVNWLVPSEMHVGGLTVDNDAEKKLELLDKAQQEWVYSEELADKNYLADVAGSGKTNVLLSRAIYKAKQYITKGGCRILVVTYSKALKLELERIFHEKIANDPMTEYYIKAIHIYDMESLMEEIVKRGIEGSRAFEIWKREYLASHQINEYIDDGLLEQCLNCLDILEKRVQIYDYLFIDEIQDFSTWFMWIATRLLKERTNIFAVGDIGQKLFDRELDWGEFDIIRHRAEIQSRFVMYRNPKPVAKLAWKFLTSDRFIESDLVDEGYKMDIKPKSPLSDKPVFISETSEEALFRHFREDLDSHLYLARPKQFLCIGMKDKMLGKLYEALSSNAIAVRWATEIAPPVGDYIVLADYVEAKGLERDYVYILDADFLAGKLDPFASEEEVQREIRRDRIKLFVALTRAKREVRLYYIDQRHLFIRQLLQNQSTA